ncbi:LysR family transcriptional regulator [Enterovirga rhinocerotis]|uniref:LysR family transcriptional regulator n=1 Tax=Enterovirga rhinocerotis TaxID=1339210 RepID=A0A4R7C8E0_9HYPH|nr:LysR family transcriptional regulator [Enterovirga rhinocerotis]TDR93116.1 LysR family transcriptional regulator [Enterovirga rhinocerotis]
MSLDLSSVRLFVLAADLGSLTRAAEAAGTVQPVVSQRLKALEARVGRRLLDRSPRFVRPTADGAAFLVRARALIAAHDHALRFEPDPEIRVAIGVSDHALGIGLTQVLRGMRRSLPPQACAELRSGLSHDLRLAFEAGRLDAVVLRRESGAQDGEVLGIDPLGWRAAEDLAPVAIGAVPLALLPGPCGVRSVAIHALEERGIAWREAFVGGSCAALLAGIRAGLGIAPMGRLAAGGEPDRGPEFGLPALPPSEIVLFARTGNAILSKAVSLLATGIRASLR